MHPSARCTHSGCDDDDDDDDDGDDDDDDDDDDFFPRAPLSFSARKQKPRNAQLSRWPLCDSVAFFFLRLGRLHNRLPEGSRKCSPCPKDHGVSPTKIRPPQTLTQSPSLEVTRVAKRTKPEITPGVALAC